MPWILAAVALVASLTLTLLFIGDLGAVAYFAVFAGVAAAGLPFGFLLFGARHAAGWIAGLLLGYAFVTLAWWLVIVAGLVSLPAFGAAWFLVAAGGWALMRLRPGVLVTLPGWSSRETAALCLLLVMVPALVSRPFTKLGSEDSEGRRLYRAYFIADFLWHTALTAELKKHEARPVNPFLAAEPLHYYWTYFRVPATVAAQSGIDVQRALKVNAVATALLFLSAIYVTAWAALPAWPLLTALAVALTVTSPSIEGLASIVDLLRRGQPLGELRNLNIDAVAAWAFKGLRIDDLPRAFWYTPQHSFACALGLMAIPVALYSGASASVLTMLLTGAALGASVSFSPLLGAMFCAIYGVSVTWSTFRERRPILDLGRQSVVVLPVVAALAWCSYTAVGEGAGDVLHFGFWGPARNATILTFLLQFGPLLLPMMAALWWGSVDATRRLAPATIGVVSAVLVMHLVTLTVDQAWVGFRGGNIFFVCAPAIVASALAGLWSAGRRRAVTVLVLAVAALGLPTTVIDAYNAQDVRNRNFAPRNEFHWTVWLTHDEQEALDWIRRNTPLRAVVQMEPTVRGRETWSVVPSFAERRMASGEALPLLARPVYDEHNARIRSIYESPDARIAWQEGRALGIDYLYVDATEREAYPRVDKFDSAPDLFTPVFRNREAVVYALRP